MKNNIKTVIVLGMHRAGTSMVAGVLARLGVDMGRELMPPNRGNPSGYYENVEFVRLNREILGQKGNVVLPLPSQADIIKQKNKFSSRIKDLVEQSQTSPLWGFKDPRASLTIGLFLPYLVNPYFIVCQRQPLAVAKSLKKRDGLDIEVGLKICAEYNRRLNKFFAQNPGLKKMFIAYEQAVAEPFKTARALADFLGLAADDKTIRQAAQFILSGWAKRWAKWRYYLKVLLS